MPKRSWARGGKYKYADDIIDCGFSNWRYGESRCELWRLLLLENDKNYIRKMNHINFGSLVAVGAYG